MNRVRILLVDDDDIALDLMESALEDPAYLISRASDGDEAWNLLSERTFHVVISDWEMPFMDGLALCRRIRAGEAGEYVYFILVTAHDSPREIIQGLEAGADDFIAKPFNPAELRMRVRGGWRIRSLESRDAGLFAIANLIESRDPETSGHLDRTQQYCGLLARELARHPDWSIELDEDSIGMIIKTCVLHDIGKAGIPDSILLKPGRLDNEEFEVVKTHTTIGGDTLESAARRYPDAAFLRAAQNIALHHHERFDGAGYPCGLKGEIIPPAARIMALADTYDALSSRRVYKKAFSHMVSRGIIIEEAGKQFDPQVVEAFLRNESAFRKISASS